MGRLIGIAAFSLAFLVPCAGLAQTPSAGSGQIWPAKLIHLIVPFAPAGPADIAARLVSQKLTELLGQQFIIENRGGAGGNLGTGIVAKAAPDGYTVLLTTSAFAVNMSLFANPGYDAEKDFIPVAMVASQPNLIFVNANVAAKTGRLAALMGTHKIAHRGGQNHAVDRESIGAAFRERFGAYPW